MNENDWSKVADDAYHNTCTERLMVPGGWLYRVVTTRSDKPHVALCFVPDPPAQQMPLAPVQFDYTTGRPADTSTRIISKS